MNVDEKIDKNCFGQWESTAVGQKEIGSDCINRFVILI